MGFLNPFIYSNPQAFTDVTVGNNAIDRSGSPAKYGFQCTKGWDPVSGMAIFYKCCKFDKHVCIKACVIVSLKNAFFILNI